MVSKVMPKLLPIMVGIVLLAAAVLGVIFYMGEITVGEPFVAEYNECVTGLSETGSFVKALKSGSTEPCKQMISTEFCQAVVLQDQSRCGEDMTCIAFVTKDVSKCNPEDATCRAFVTRDPSHCDELDIDAREECKAVLELNAKYFSSKWAKQNCLDSVVSVLADDVGHCDQIKNAQLRGDCESRFA